VKASLILLSDMLNLQLITYTVEFLSLNENMHLEQISSFIYFIEIN